MREKRAFFMDGCFEPSKQQNDCHRRGGRDDDEGALNMALNKEDFKHGAFFVVGMIVVAAVGIYIWSDEKACAEKGGERLRPLFGTFRCYDKASLREVAPGRRQQPHDGLGD